MSFEKISSSSEIFTNAIANKAKYKTRIKLEYKYSPKPAHPKSVVLKRGWQSLSKYFPKSLVLSWILAISPSIQSQIKKEKQRKLPIIQNKLFGKLKRIAPEIPNNNDKRVIKLGLTFGQILSIKKVKYFEILLVT